MLGLSRASLIAPLLTVWICCSNAFAANCSSTWIKSVADADKLRQNCRIVYGHVGIGPFADNGTVHINLDGVEMIAGTLGESPLMQSDDVTQPYYTLSSSSLEVVDAVEIGYYGTKVVNLSLPSLKSARDYFEVGKRAYNLTYLDISSLNFAPSITLSPPNLTTLHHTGLRNVTAMSIDAMKIDSLDSLTDNQLNMSQVFIQGPFPNVNEIAIGFISAKHLHINDNSSLTLGGSSTTAMTIKELSLHGITDLKPTMGDPSHEIYHSSPKAVDWTGGFDLDIVGAPDLNLTSIYGVNDKGNRVQTWYWPKNVSRIRISDVTVGNAFFDPFVAQQKGPWDSQFPPSAVRSFGVSPSVNSSFNCTPFVELQSMGRLPDVPFMCDNSKPPTSGVPVHLPIPLSLVSAVLGVCILML
ncbi:hypothetical protein N7489_003701 [Penicillium chrysogenum]|uniref:uncharacterized protein n=1 Tax=Penicillium chrysogenum TaxID=5076 RepID=UPI00239D8B6E|nr:uncharacterized protein N7489_003701 [Penicillium chrysogenum]KAJ5243605.1 hypothetical protein N7489_003701 [Penicillium chrysogenum]KAJ5257377.1 hypothetical protein N7524_008933 [Penicillium chrysogenum]